MENKKRWFRFGRGITCFMSRVSTFDFTKALFQPGGIMASAKFPGQVCVASRDFEVHEWDGNVVVWNETEHSRIGSKTTSRRVPKEEIQAAFDRISQKEVDRWELVEAQVGDAYESSHEVSLGGHHE